MGLLLLPKRPVPGILFLMENASLSLSFVTRGLPANCETPNSRILPTHIASAARAASTTHTVANQDATGFQTVTTRRLDRLPTMAARRVTTVVASASTLALQVRQDHAFTLSFSTLLQHSW